MTNIDLLNEQLKELGEEIKIDQTVTHGMPFDLGPSAIGLDVVAVRPGDMCVGEEFTDKPMFFVKNPETGNLFVVELPMWNIKKLAEQMMIGETHKDDDDDLPAYEE